MNAALLTLLHLAVAAALCRPGVLLGNDVDTLGETGLPE